MRSVIASIVLSVIVAAAIGADAFVSSKTGSAFVASARMGRQQQPQSGSLMTMNAAERTYIMVSALLFNRKKVCLLIAGIVLSDR